MGVEIISTNIASSVQVPEWRPDSGLIFLKSEEFFLKLQRTHSPPSAVRRARVSRRSIVVDASFS